MEEESEIKKVFFNNPKTGSKYEMPRNPNLDVEITKIIIDLVGKDDKFNAEEFARRVFALARISKVDLEERLDKVLKGE